MSAVLPAGIRAFESIADGITAVSAGTAVRRAAVIIFGRAAKPVAALTRPAILNAVPRILIRAADLIATTE